MGRGKVSFVEVNDPERYREKIAGTRTLAMLDPEVSVCDLGPQSNCQQSKSAQFIDQDRNRKHGKSEPYFSMSALFKDHFIRSFDPFEPAEDGAPLEELGISIDVGENEFRVSLTNPMVADGIPATHIKNFIVQDLNNDGLFDISFELASANAQRSALKVYLQGSNDRPPVDTAPPIEQPPARAGQVHEDPWKKMSDVDRAAKVTEHFNDRIAKLGLPKRVKIKAQIADLVKKQPSLETAIVAAETIVASFEPKK